GSSPRLVGSARCTARSRAPALHPWCRARCGIRTQSLLLLCERGDVGVGEADLCDRDGAAVGEAVLGADDGQATLGDGVADDLGRCQQPENGVAEVLSSDLFGVDVVDGGAAGGLQYT